MPQQDSLVVWDGTSLRQLRHRLAWSQAEMARHLGCKLEDLALWESQTVTKLDFIEDNRLDSLARHLEVQSDQVAKTPVAEAIMHRQNLTQIHKDQIDSDLAKRSFRLTETEK